MTAKKSPADLKPKSVPTTPQERAAYRAILRRCGIELHPSTNGATLRARVLALSTTHYFDPSGQIVQRRAEVHQEALDDDAQYEAASAELAEEMRVGLIGPPIAPDRAAQLSAAAKKAWETRRAKQAAQAVQS